MEPVIIAAIIGGTCAIIAGVGGALLGKSEFFDRIFRGKDVPSFIGTKWESKWIEKDNGGEIELKEYLEFNKQRGNKVYGIITSDQFPDMKSNLEGDYNDRFLRLL